MARVRKDVGAETSALVPEKAAAAFESVAPSLEALSPESVITPEGDVTLTVTQALHAYARLSDWRDPWLSALPQLPIEALDDLERLAQATWYVDIIARHTEGDASSGGLEDEALELREGLLIGAEALAHRGLLDRDIVSSIRKGLVNLGNDLVTLAALYTAEWPRLVGKTAVEKKEVERAAKIGPELAMVDAVRAFTSGSTSMSPAELRARAYTALVNAYEICRRAAVYLRWSEGDAESMVPALPKKRTAKKTKSEEGSEGHVNGASEVHLS